MLQSARHWFTVAVLHSIQHFDTVAFRFFCIHFVLSYGHVLQKEDNDWLKKCMEYEVEVPGQEVD